jgi:hypothetical protein
MQNNTVHVLFLRPTRSDPFLNRLTSYMGRMTHGVEACHVELCMPHLGGFLTSSIYNGETVNVTMSKTFSNPGAYCISCNFIEFLIYHADLWSLQQGMMYTR